MGFFSKIKKLWSVEDRLDDAVKEFEKEAGVAPVAAETKTEPVAREAAVETVVARPEPAVLPAAKEPMPSVAAPAPEPETPPAARKEAAAAAPPSAAEPASAAPKIAPAAPVAPPAPPKAVEHAEAVFRDKPQRTVVPYAEAPLRGEAVEVSAVEAAIKIDRDAPVWQKELLLSLREAEPRLSAWLSLILTGVDRAGDLLWERLAFLLRALEVPEKESGDFLARFRKWLDDMEYERVEEFRSELQYRLALALELEDEEDERDRLFLKLSQGLSKTREQISKRIERLTASHKTIDEGFWEELEEILIMADVGFEPSTKLVERLRKRVREAGTTDPARFKDFLRDELEDIFKMPKRISAVNPPEVIMVIGVNGVGKTTTIAKLAHRAQMQGRKVLVAAGDTFRAAAIEQLEVWVRRVGAGFYAKGENADPAAVAFEAVEKAVAEGYDLLLLDTAGRLHTKTNLMEELQKIHRVLGKKHPGAPHRTVLVVDATTGQNALSQTKLFDEAVGVDEIILTKLDGTAKGGIVVAIALEHAKPITFVGLGERLEDLRPFDGGHFATALLS